MKSFIKKSLNSIGIDISKFKNSPYEYLLNQPRYKKRIIDLNGNKFKISDAPSFYWSFREIFTCNRTLFFLDF